MTSMNPEKGCREIHRLLEQLPIRTEPTRVPFVDGLYFFYEAGEASEHGPVGRIVRVGNHPRSNGGLVRRLRQHYSGRKNGSVFRKLLGGALLRTNDPQSPCLAPGPGRGHWERQGGKTCYRCRSIEREVSALLRSRFSFRCIAIQDRAERNHFESLLIATLAACSICRASSRWLGLHAYSDTVPKSGLWNTQFVDGPTMEEDDIQRFGELVKLSLETSRRSM